VALYAKKSVPLKSVVEKPKTKGVSTDVETGCPAMSSSSPKRRRLELLVARVRRRGEDWRVKSRHSSYRAVASKPTFKVVVETDRVAIVVARTRSVPHDAGPSLMHTQLWRVFV